jgi:hypothetical protein
VGTGLGAGVVYGQESAVFWWYITLPLSRVSVHNDWEESLGRSVGLGLGLNVLQLVHLFTQKDETLKIGSGRWFAP